MITPQAVTELASPLIDLYTQMEDDLIRNIASRFPIDNKLTGTSEWQIKQIYEMGMLNKQNIRAIAKYSKLSDDHVQSVIASAGYTSVLSDETLYQMAYESGALMVEALPVAASPMMRNLLNATIRNVRTEMNLVNTTALETANKLFIDTVNQVFLEVNTGTYTYDQAVRKAVVNIGQTGIKGAHYISERGKHTYNQLDVAVKRCILTSSSQVAGEMQLARAKEWGSNFVEVTSHMAARPSHALWQGKIFMIDGSDEKYRNLVEATDYGSITGLKGANCSHDFYPYFPGISTQTYKPYDRDANAKAYDNAQIQRKHEREIRAEKRKAVAADASGDTESLTAAKRKISDKQAELRQHVSDTGRTRRNNREQVVGYTRSIDSKAAAAVKAYGAKPLKVPKQPVKPIDQVIKLDDLTKSRKGNT